MSKTVLAFATATVLALSGCTSVQRAMTISDATEAELDATLVHSGDLPGWSSEGVIRDLPRADIQNIEDQYSESGFMLCDTSPRLGPEFTSPDGKYFVYSFAERVCGDPMEFARNNVGTDLEQARADLEDMVAEMGARVSEFSASEVNVRDTLPNLVWDDHISAVTVYRITAVLESPEVRAQLERLVVSVYSTKIRSTLYFEAYDTPVDRSLATRVASAAASRHKAGSASESVAAPSISQPDSTQQRDMLEQTATSIARFANAHAAFNEGRNINETNDSNIDYAVGDAALSSADGWSVDTSHPNGAQLSLGSHTVCITAQPGSPARAVVEQSTCANATNQKLPWRPAGFDMVNADETLAVRWLPEKDAASMSCPAAGGCWYVEVLSRLGCSIVQVELNVVTDSGSTLATITGELRANLQPDTKGIVIVKSYDTYEAYGSEPMAQIVDATCA